MELTNLEGKIIGVIGKISDNSNYDNLIVKDIIGEKYEGALKVVGCDISNSDKVFKTLPMKEQKKVLLASKLSEEVIILNNFSKGLIYKDLIYFKNLLKKISNYNRKIILIGNDLNFLFNLIDYLYIIENEKIIYATTDLKDEKLYDYIDRVPIIEFVYLAKQKGIKLDYYLDFFDLLKAIYRLKQ